MQRVGVFVALVLVAGCGDPQPAGGVAGVGAGSEVISLPEPSASALSVSDAMGQRRSVRDYTAEPLSEAEVSDLLWAAQGVTSSSGKRTAPSAGALYPLETYLVTAEGLFRYLPDGHRLEVLGGDDLREPLARAALGQEAVEAAPAVLVITAVYARTEQKYGDRSERYVHMEAGHAAQNLLLQATALGLGSVPIGAFNDYDVQAVLGVPADHQPLYLIPVGRPA